MSLYVLYNNRQILKVQALPELDARRVRHVTGNRQKTRSLRRRPAAAQPHQLTGNPTPVMRELLERARCAPVPAAAGDPAVEESFCNPAPRARPVAARVRESRG
jgi:hypothetical protein